MDNNNNDNIQLRIVRTLWDLRKFSSSRLSGRVEDWQDNFFFFLYIYVILIEFAQWAALNSARVFGFAVV